MIHHYLFGLGNPGKDYKNSRHNLGFFCADALAQARDIPWQKKDRFQAEIAVDSSQRLVIAKPQTFMNESGRAVQAILKWYEKEDLENVRQNFAKLYVMYDDLDLSFGSYKIQFGRHPKIHNGVNSIIQYLHTDQFWHVRIGTDTGENRKHIPSEKFVLLPLTLEEMKKISPVMQTIIQELYASIFSS